MKSLSEMIKPTEVRPIPFFCNIGLIESEDKNLWELATHNGVMTFSVDYIDDAQAAVAECQVVRGDTVHKVVRVGITSCERFDAEELIHIDMMNVIRNIAKTHGCDAEVYDEHDWGKAYRMFDDFDEEEKRLYINFTKKPEEEI